MLNLWPVVTKPYSALNARWKYHAASGDDTPTNGPGGARNGDPWRRTCCALPLPPSNSRSAHDPRDATASSAHMHDAIAERRFSAKATLSEDAWRQ